MRKPEPTCKNCSYVIVYNCGRQYSTEQLLIFPLPSNHYSLDVVYLRAVSNYNNPVPNQQNGRSQYSVNHLCLELHGKANLHIKILRDITQSQHCLH